MVSQCLLCSWLNAVLQSFIGAKDVSIERPEQSFHTNYWKSISCHHTNIWDFHQTSHITFVFRQYISAIRRSALVELSNFIDWGSLSQIMVNTDTLSNVQYNNIIHWEKVQLQLKVCGCGWYGCFTESLDLVKSKLVIQIWKFQSKLNQEFRER